MDKAVLAEAAELVERRLNTLRSMTDAELLGLGDSLDEDIVVGGIEARCEVWGNPPSDPGHVFAVRVLTKEKHFLWIRSYSVLAEGGFILANGVRTPMTERDFWIY
jgi:hypothetical protein